MGDVWNERRSGDGNVDGNQKYLVVRDCASGGRRTGGLGWGGPGAVGGGEGWFAIWMEGRKYASTIRCQR